jgi:hypothetical protein
MDKLESNLSPTQAVLLWMNEAHEFGSIEEYARYLKTQPDSVRPIRRLVEQMTTSVEQAKKGKPKPEIHRALRQAGLDVLFLFFLHQQVNGMLLDKERYFACHALMLDKELASLARERMHNDQAMWNRLQVGLRMPYPLDPETAQAVGAAIKHNVIPWEVLEEGDEIYGWLINHYLSKGKTELPDGAYKLQDESVSHSGPDMEEVRALFADPAEFEKLLAGEDYSYGLSDVTDTEFNEHYETIVSAMKDLGFDGLIVELPTVPHAFLRDAPLVEGEWIDRYVVELAEWGARLAQQSLVLEESDDPHPLAWFRVTDQEKQEEAQIGVTSKLRNQTRRHLARFTGRTQEIKGRQHLHWEDYLGWRGRRVKGDLTSGLSTGLFLSPWNRWVEDHNDKETATLVGVHLGQLSCHAQGYQYRICVDTEERNVEQRQRRSLLDSLWINKPENNAEERFHERVNNWKELAQTFLVELYTLRRVIVSINRRYFEGQDVLFSKVGEGFGDLVEYIEGLSDLYNRNLSEGLDRLATLATKGDSGKSTEPFCLDLPALENLVAKPGKHRIAYLVDMAKFEALDTIGENQKAVESLHRYV